MILKQLSNGDLEEELYMAQPEVFIVKESKDMVGCIMRSERVGLPENGDGKREILDKYDHTIRLRKLVNFDGALIM